MNAMDEHISENTDQSPVSKRRTNSTVRFRRAGKLMFVSAFLSPEQGCVGVDTTPEEAKEAGRELAYKVLETLKHELGSVRQIRQFVKMLGLVHSGGDFDGMPAAMNGFSDVMVTELGERGLHARSAVGVVDLPDHALLSVSLILEVKEIVYDF